MTSVHFLSQTDMWETPQWLFDELNTEFHFTVDVCATAGNAKCDHYFTRSIDGLIQPWHGICWMNPPYGRAIGMWVKKASDSAADGATVVCLLPARTDTGWWHDYVMKSGECRFIRGRVRFSGAGSAPFPSAVVIFRPAAVR